MSINKLKAKAPIQPDYALYKTFLMDWSESYQQAVVSDNFDAARFYKSRIAGAYYILNSFMTWEEISELVVCTDCLPGA